MIETSIQFEISGVTYTAYHLDKYQEIIGNWWRCDVLDISVAVPDGTLTIDIIAAFIGSVSQEVEEC